jgi:hypothetical protein
MWHCSVRYRRNCLFYISLMFESLHTARVSSCAPAGDRSFADSCPVSANPRPHASPASDARQHLVTDEFAPRDLRCPPGESPYHTSINRQSAKKPVRGKDRSSRRRPSET